MILDRSNTVPTVTLKGFSQARHLQTPGRVDLPLSFGSLVYDATVRANRAFGPKQLFEVLPGGGFVLCKSVRKVHGPTPLTPTCPHITVRYVKYITANLVGMLYLTYPTARRMVLLIGAEP